MTRHLAIVEGGRIANVIFGAAWPGAYDITDLEPRPCKGWRLEHGLFIEPDPSAAVVAAQALLRDQVTALRWEREAAGLAAGLADEALAAHVHACFSAERMHHVAIAELTDLPAVEAYDPTAGWPDVEEP